jgi:DNA end-binding protein Ku
MAERSIWKGLIHFRDVDVPVKLHTAVKEERIQFHFLHKRDHIRLKQQMVCAYEKVPVPVKEQIRGFELEEGKYILVDQAELEQIDPEDSRMIEIHEFVTTGQIDPVYLDRVYYLEPDIDLKRYSALAGALREMGLEGICTWTMRKRSYTGVLQVSGKILRLHALRYSDEVVPARSLELEDTPLSEKELKIGKVLIDQLSGPFQPQKFENEHEKKLQTLIQRKARGERILLSRPKRLKPTTPDRLLKTLEASLKRVA